MTDDLLGEHPMNGSLKTLYSPFLRHTLTVVFGVMHARKEPNNIVIFWSAAEVSK
jgi:hypothetical protein